MMLATLLDALSVLLPVTCAGCSANDRSLCAHCRTQLAPCPRQQRLADGVVVTSALSYEGVVRSAVIAFKESGRTDVATALAAPLAAAVLASAALAGASEVALPARIYVIAMPIGRQAYRRRGFDPVRLLLKRASIGPPLEGLIGVRSHEVQKGLDREARALNLAGTMGVRGDLRGVSVLLVDDVVTTGSTILEAARALRAVGATVVGAAVVAATPRLYGDSWNAQSQRSDMQRLQV